MPIQSQNAVLNQYVPPFCVDRPVAGETFIYDPNKKTWKNKALTASDLGGVAPDGLVWQGGIYGPGDVVTISEDLTTFVSTPRSEFGSGEGGATKLNDLSDVAIVAPSDKQGFIYNIVTGKWENNFTSYSNLINVPSEFTPSPHFHVETDITDLDKYTQAEVDALIFSGSYNDLTDVPSDFNPSAHTHVKAEITDFNEADYATAAQGDLADSALQAGANISLLTNDAGYLTTGLQAGDNISLLTNDAGYIADITAQSIGDLSDVDTTGAFDGAILTWNGSSFILDEKTFIKGTDTPSSYAGQSGKILSVNSEENAVEFTDIIDGGDY